MPRPALPPADHASAPRRGRRGPDVLQNSATDCSVARCARQPVLENLYRARSSRDGGGCSAVDRRVLHHQPHDLASDDRTPSARLVANQREHPAARAYPRCSRVQSESERCLASELEPSAFTIARRPSGTGSPSRLFSRLRRLVPDFTLNASNASAPDRDRRRRSDDLRRPEIGYPARDGSISRANPSNHRASRPRGSASWAVFAAAS